MDAKIEYLKMIQAVIDRMSRFGFLVKAWAITLVTAVMVLSVEQGKPMMLLIALFATFGFWYLDAFFLHTEKKYRVLYNKARVLHKDNVIDFDLTPPSAGEDGVLTMSDVAVSKTLRWFWGMLIIIVLFVTALA